LRRVQLQPQDQAEVAADAEACSMHTEVFQGPLQPPNNSMQRTALRAAADAGR
jgi:hypothetical protein